MKPGAKKSLPDRPSKPSNVVHPCFNCGLIFSKKEEHVQHMERYHNSRHQDGSGGLRCHECDQIFASDEKAFNEHLLVHDLNKIIGVLRRSEMAKKRIQPLVVHAPPDTTPISKGDIVWEQEEKTVVSSSESVAPPIPPAPPVSSKGKTYRPRNKSTLNTPTSKSSGTTTATSSSQSATPSSVPSEPARKRKRISKEPPLGPSTPVQLMVPPIATSSPLVQPTTDTSPLNPPDPEPTAAVIAEPKTPPTSFSSPQSSSATSSPQLHLMQPLVLPSSPTVQRIMPTLQSSCPNCNQNLGKPWHLVDHMIQQHDAQLLRLHRTLKKPDGVTGMTVISQMFNDRQCPFCQLSFADLQLSLLHVVRTHRSRLFECPDNGECVLTCELMCAIGPDASQKKFTISVKVKRRINE